MADQNAKERTPTPPHTCGGCDATWTGSRPAHASCCHRTFASVALFDAHRSAAGEYGRCIDPVGLTNRAGYRTHLWRDGMWRSPEMTEDEKAAAFGRRG